MRRLRRPTMSNLTKHAKRMYHGANSMRRHGFRHIKSFGLGMLAAGAAGVGFAKSAERMAQKGVREARWAEREVLHDMKEGVRFTGRIAQKGEMEVERGVVTAKQLAQTAERDAVIAAKEAGRGIEAAAIGAASVGKAAVNAVEAEKAELKSRREDDAQKKEDTNDEDADSHKDGDDNKDADDDTKEDDNKDGDDDNEDGDNDTKEDGIPVSTKVSLSNYTPVNIRI